MRIIKNGALVTEEGLVYADMAIDGGKIAAIASALPTHDGDEVIDASGMMVFPGFIDGHTHFDMDSGVTVTADDFATGTRAAVAGGTTMVIDFATQNRGDTLAHGLEEWHRKADGRSSCHYAFHMAITDWNEHTRQELKDMFDAGVSSFKLYLAYDNLRLSDEAVYDILREMKRLGGLVGVHCENGDLVNAGIKRQKEQGQLSPAAHPAARPPVVEAEAVRRLLAISQLTGCTVNIVHLSSAAGLDEIRRARAQGLRVQVETCPQYMLLNEDCYHLAGFDSAKFVCSPPIRSEADRRAIVNAMLSGEIDTIATDHCSYTLKQKAIGKEDFSKIPNGMPGVEHRPAVIFSHFVATGRMSAAEMSRLLATNPARQFGLYPRKGTLRVGSDADIVLWDPAATQTITAKAQLQNTDNTPYEGMTLTGRAKAVLLMGETVVEDGNVVKENCGCYTARQPVEV